MTNKMKTNGLEMLAIMITIFSVTFMINSILVSGFNLNPISITVGTMISLFIVFIKNIFAGNTYDGLLKVINVGENPNKDYGMYIFYLIFLDFLFVFLKIV